MNDFFDWGSAWGQINIPYKHDYNWVGWTDADKEAMQQLAKMYAAWELRKLLEEYPNSPDCDVLGYVLLCRKMAERANELDPPEVVELEAGKVYLLPDGTKVRT
jgi:hypothetical protein